MVCHGSLAWPASWGWLSRLMAARRTLGAPPSRVGPNRRGCGAVVTPHSRSSMALHTNPNPNPNLTLTLTQI